MVRKRDILVVVVWLVAKMFEMFEMIETFEKLEVMFEVRKVVVG
jgi:hypothetical protein